MTEEKGQRRAMWSAPMRVFIKIFASIATYFAVWKTINLDITPLLPDWAPEPGFLGFVVLVGALTFIWADEFERREGWRPKCGLSTALMRIAVSVAVYVLVMLAISAGVHLYFGEMGPEAVLWHERLTTIGLYFVIVLVLFIWIR